MCSTRFHAERRVSEHEAEALAVIPIFAAAWISDSQQQIGLGDGIDSRVDLELHLRGNVDLLGVCGDGGASLDEHAPRLASSSRRGAGRS